jgi:hypothetical protein
MAKFYLSIFKKNYGSRLLNISWSVRNLVLMIRFFTGNSLLVVVFATGKSNANSMM